MSALIARSIDRATREREQARRTFANPRQNVRALSSPPRPFQSNQSNWVRTRSFATTRRLQLAKHVIMDASRVSQQCSRAEGLAEAGTESAWPPVPMGGFIML
jgi:hypothetical protein